MTGLNKRAKSIIQLKPRNPTTAVKGKLPIQAVCDFKQQEVSEVYSLEWSQILTLTSWMCVLMSYALCFRSQSTKEMNVLSSITLSPSSGRSWTTLDTRRWCPPSASWCLQLIRRPWMACQGERIRNSYEMDLLTMPHLSMQRHIFCFLIIAPHAFLPSSSLDAGHQQMISMWQRLHIDMKSLLSWQYLMKDFSQIRSWNITMVSTKTKQNKRNRNPWNTLVHIRVVNFEHNKDLLHSMLSILKSALESVRKQD